MKEGERQNQETLSIRDGLSAIVLPELGRENQFKQQTPETEEVTMSKLNTFLDSLNAQGVDIVSIIDIEVVGESRSGVVGASRETKKVAIIRKK